MQYILRIVRAGGCLAVVASGGALAAQARGVQGSTPGDCQLFFTFLYFRLITSRFVYSIQLLAVFIPLVEFLASSLSYVLRRKRVCKSLTSYLVSGTRLGFCFSNDNMVGAFLCIPYLQVVGL